MNDRNKTKKQLIEELEKLRKLTANPDPPKSSTEINPGNLYRTDFSYKTFYEFSPIMYFTVDYRGEVLSVNPVGAEHLGYREEELVGESVLKVFYADDRDRVVDCLNKCLKHPMKTYRWEFRKVKKDGEVIWVKEHARAQSGTNGERFVTIACEDITEQKHADLLLNTENKIFEMIARNTSLSEILSLLCREIEGQSDGMLCSFLVLDEAGLTLKHGAAPSLPKEYVKAVDGVKIGPCVGSCGTAAYTKEPVTVTDIETDPLWADYKDLALKHDLRACWSTPIISSDDKVLGTFAMYYKELRAPSPREKILIDTAVHLARLAIEKVSNQELAAHKVEQLSKKSRYETIVRAVTESVHKSLDLNEVFDNAVEALNKNVEGADNVVIFMVEGNEAVMKASRGHSDSYLKRVSRIPYPKGATWKTIIEGKARYVSDTDKDEVLGQAGKDFGTKSYLSMPIRSEDKSIGCIHIHSPEKNTFREQDLDMLQIVARQLESAIRNAEQAQALRRSQENIKRQLDELSKKQRYEEIINTVTRSVHSSINLQEVLNNAVEAMNKNIDHADNVSIYFVEDKEAVIQAYRGYPDWFIDIVRRIPHPKGFTWRTITERKLIYCPDVEKDGTIGPAGRKVGTLSYASMPINYEGETIGCININSLRKNAFDQDELKLLEIIAAQIEIAVNNARRAEALRESEERYRTLFEQTPVGVFIFNKDLIITHTNRRHTEIIQVQSDKMIGIDIKKLKDQTFTHIMEKALEGETNSEEGLYKATNSAAELYLRVSAAPLSDAEGHIVGGMSVVEDITERKRAEESLRQSQQNYEVLVNTIEGIVWEADIEPLKFKFVSKQAEHILGYPSEDWTDEKQIWLGKLHPEDRKWVPKYCESETARKRDHSIEYRMIAADGRTVWLRDIVSVILENDKVTGLRGLMVDITDLKNAEGLIKESAVRYRTLVENIHDLVAESSSDGKFVYLSPNYTTTLGYDPQDLVGRNIFEHIHPEDLQMVKEEFIRAITSKSSGKAVFRYRHRNGTWRWFESTGQTVETASGDLNCVIVSRDITERRKMEEELFKSQKLESLGVLAGGIAHDFNNLLTVILGNISVSKMKLGTQNKIYGMLAEAEKASFRARDLTSQLLTFSRGGAPVKEYVQSIGELVKDTANFSASGSKVKCEYKIEDNLWPAEVDGGQISQVIHNLVINADQAMPEGGIITISIKNELVDKSNDLHIKEGRYIKLTIKDTGIGMTEELKEKIFDPYFTTKQRGSGLGLATVYSIVKNHEGHIEVNSQIGVGTKFDIYLPAAKDIKREHVDEPDLVKGAGKILIMDDETTVIEIVGEMLTHLGYTVDFASDGAEAIEKYMEARENGEPFDAVMLDLTIPGGMGGLEAQKKLLEFDPDVKAIVSSGYSNDPVMAEYRAHGFSGVVTKPYNVEELCQTLNGVIDRDGIHMVQDDRRHNLT